MKPALFAVLMIFAASAGLNAQDSKPLFSEDFESGGIDKTVWSEQVTGDNVLKVQSDRVAHGKYALLALPRPVAENSRP